MSEHVWNGLFEEVAPGTGDITQRCKNCGERAWDVGPECKGEQQIDRQATGGGIPKDQYFRLVQDLIYRRDALNRAIEALSIAWHSGAISDPIITDKAQGAATPGPRETAEAETEEIQGKEQSQ